MSKYWWIWNLLRKNSFEKSLTMPKKIEREDPLGFLNIHSVGKLQKIERGTLWWKKFFFEKQSHSAKKI